MLGKFFAYYMCHTQPTALIFVSNKTCYNKITLNVFIFFPDFQIGKQKGKKIKVINISVYDNNWGVTTSNEFEKQTKIACKIIKKKDWSFMMWFDKF